MPYCPNCGATVERGKRCPECGEWIKEKVNGDSADPTPDKDSGITGVNIEKAEKVKIEREREKLEGAKEKSDEQWKDQAMQILFLAENYFDENFLEEIKNRTKTFFNKYKTKMDTPTKELFERSLLRLDYLDGPIDIDEKELLKDIRNSIRQFRRNNID